MTMAIVAAVRQAASLLPPTTPGAGANRIRTPNAIISAIVRRRVCVSAA